MAPPSLDRVLKPPSHTRASDLARQYKLGVYGPGDERLFPGPSLSARSGGEGRRLTVPVPEHVKELRVGRAFVSGGRSVCEATFTLLNGMQVTRSGLWTRDVIAIVNMYDSHVGPSPIRIVDRGGIVK